MSATLFNAVKDGDYETVKKIINDEGIDVNSTKLTEEMMFGDDSDEIEGFDETMIEFTLLMIACTFGRYEICKFLIEKGADVNRHIVRYANTEDECVYTTALHQAIDNTFAFFTDSKFEVCKLLIQKGADINAKDGNGQTPLKSASYLDNASDLRILLLENGSTV